MFVKKNRRTLSNVLLKTPPPAPDTRNRVTILMNGSCTCNLFGGKMFKFLLQKKILAWLDSDASVPATNTFKTTVKPRKGKTV